MRTCDEVAMLMSNGGEALSAQTPRASCGRSGVGRTPHEAISKLFSFSINLLSVVSASRKPPKLTFRARRLLFVQASL